MNHDQLVALVVLGLMFGLIAVCTMMGTGVQ